MKLELFFKSGTNRKNKRSCGTLDFSSREGEIGTNHVSRLGAKMSENRKFHLAEWWKGGAKPDKILTDRNGGHLHRPGPGKRILLR